MKYSGLPLAAVGFLWVGLAVAMPLHSAAATVQAAASARVSGAPAAPSDSRLVMGPRWWQAFNDAALNLLMEEALRHDAAKANQHTRQDVLVASVYFEARVATARMNAARLLRAAVARQIDIVRAEDPGASDTLQLLQTRTELAATVIAQLQGVRGSALGRLAELTGAPSSQGEALGQTLDPVLRSSDLPVPAISAPLRLRTSVLRSRADVAQIEARLTRAAAHSLREQKRLDDFLAMLEQEIEPLAPQVQTSEVPPADDDAARLLSDLQAEVGQLIWAIEQDAQSTRAEEDRTREMEANYLKAESSYRAGRMTELELLEQLQAYLFQGDRLIAKAGGLVFEWIELQRKLAGSR